MYTHLRLGRSPRNRLRIASTIPLELFIKAHDRFELSALSYPKQPTYVFFLHWKVYPRARNRIIISSLLAITLSGSATWHPWQGSVNQKRKYPRLSPGAMSDRLNTLVKHSDGNATALVHIKFLAGTACRSWCPSLINALCLGPVSGIQMFRHWPPPYLFFSRPFVGWPHGSEHCVQLRQQPSATAAVSYSPSRCIAATVHCNVWPPIICKTGGVGWTVLAGPICLTSSTIPIF